MIRRIPEARETGERAGVDITPVWVANDAHRLREIVDVGYEEAELRIESSAVVVDATLCAGHRDGVTVELGRSILNLTQQHIVVVDVTLTPRLMLRRIFVEIRPAYRNLGKRLGHYRKGLCG